MIDETISKLCCNIVPYLDDPAFDLPPGLRRSTKDLIKAVYALPTVWNKAISNLPYIEQEKPKADTCECEKAKPLYAKPLYSDYDVHAAYVDGYLEGMKTAAEDLGSVMKAFRNSA